jgi:DnaJ-class molecular chaperone
VPEDFSAEALTISLEEAPFNWHEILGVPPNADAAAVRRAMTRLDLRFHPYNGDQPEQMSRINEAHEAARPSHHQKGRRPAEAQGDRLIC